MNDIILAANRCLECKHAPCVSACPLGNNIPGFMAAVKRADFTAASEIVTVTNPFPEICGRVCATEKQCEAACVRARTGTPVAIGRVEAALSGKPAEPKVADNVPKVAVVGSGPAGLAFAWRFFARTGTFPDLYEAAPYLGGLLTTGIPEFRLNYSIVKTLVAKIPPASIIHRRAKPAELLKKYDFIFLAIGRNRAIKPPLAENARIKSAGAFLTYYNKLQKALPGEETAAAFAELPIKNQSVVILGGGNVAIDAARVCRRLGASRVVVAYRRLIGDMPANKSEIACARSEGIEILPLLTLRAYEAGLATFHKMIVTGKDPAGRNAVNETEEQVTIPCTLILYALGSYPAGVEGLELATQAGGRLVTDPFGQTSHPRIFAGGDLVNDNLTVVHAIAGGQKAAERIIALYKKM